MNKFLKGFESKSNQELELILSKKGKYTESALLAALEILKTRSGDLTDLDAKKKGITQIKQEQNETEKNENLTPRQKEKKFITNDPNDPELYSKGVIIGFSLFFSTLFGAILLMHNMKKTNNLKARKLVFIFGVFYTSIVLFILIYFQIESNINFLINGIGGAVLTEFLWNKHIGKEFLFRSKSCIKPAIISTIIIAPIIILAIYGQ